MMSKCPNWCKALLLPALLSACLTLPVSFAAPISPEIRQADKDFTALMTRGKIEADLGNYENAASTFSSIAHDAAAPARLQWEALVRYGLVSSAAGNSEASVEAFRMVSTGYSEEPKAVGMLMRALASGLPGKVWIDFKPEFEELLRSAEIVSLESLGMGESQPKVAYLKRGDVELKAIWRPQRDENLATEVAAYELDKILGLDMVPPTVDRAVEGRPGMLQLWVHGCRTLSEVRNRFPGTREQEQEFSRVRLFDRLIANQDRNWGNILIDPQGGIVLVDHSHTFSDTQDVNRLPERCDRMLVEKLQTLSKVGMQVRLKGILREEDISNMLQRRDRILALIERLVTKDGEAGVFF